MYVCMYVCMYMCVFECVSDSANEYMYIPYAPSHNDSFAILRRGYGN